MTKVRLIQVGLGGWGLDWAEQVLPTVETVEVVARVDPEAAAFARLRALVPGVDPRSCFASLAEALTVVDCDLVLASLPTAFHVATVREALLAGKHVIVEKPFAPTVPDAAALVRLAEERSRFLMVSQNYRHYPAPIAAAALVAGRELGAPLSVTLDFRRFVDETRYRYWDIPDPLLADMAIHHFDLMRMVLGEEPVEVSCRTWNPKGSPFQRHPSAFATITFTGDVVVSYRGSWLSRGADTPWAGEWAMDLERGAVFWTSRGNQEVRLTADRLAVRPLGGAVEEQEMAPLRHFDRAGTTAAIAAAIGNGTPPPFFSSGRDNLGSLALVEASIRSAAEGGKPVRLDSVLTAELGEPSR